MTSPFVGQTFQEPLTTFWSAVTKYGLAVAALIFYFTVVLHFSYTPDDTYIYLQYGKNLSRGAGFSFNAGTPSYGITGPLWVLLIAAGARVGLDPFMVAKTFDILFASISIILTQILAYVIIKDKVYAFFAGWMFSFDAWFIRWTGSGMETSLAILLTLMAVWYSFHREYYLGAFACGLLTLVRPEGALLFVVIGFDEYIEAKRLNLSQRYLVWSLAIFAATVIPWLIFSYVHFGTILPNTLAAKTGNEFQIADVASTVLGIFKIMTSTQLVTILILVFSLSAAVSKVGLGPTWEIAFPVAWIVLLPFSYIVQNVQVVSRYLLPLTPLIIIYALWGMKRMEEAWSVPYPKALKILSLVAGVSLLQNVFVYRSQIVPHVVNFTVGMNNCIKPIAYWLRSNSPEEASVVAPDIGLLGYISEKTIYDPAGIVTPNLRKAFAGASYDDGMLHRSYERVIRPDFVVDRSVVKERLLSDSLRPVLTAEFPGLGISKPERVYYTLYKVVK